MINTGQIVVRDAIEGDLNFILNSWLKSFRNSPFARNIPNEVYFSNHEKLIKNCLSKSTVKIVSPTSDLGRIIGYVVYSNIDDITILHYTYVKVNYRKFNICDQLLLEAGIDGTKAGLYTQHTTPMNRLQHKYNLIYSPYLIHEM